MSRKGFHAALSRDDTKWPVKRPDSNSFEGNTEVMDSAKACEAYVKFHLKLQKLWKKNTQRLVPKKKKKKVCENQIVVHIWSSFNILP